MRAAAPGWCFGALAGGLAACLAAVTAYAHPAPNSVLRLEFQPDGVRAEYWVPVSELAHARTADPHGGEFPSYLLRHFAVETPAGARWRVTIERVREADYLQHDFLVADLHLLPPVGAPPRRFVLVDDTVTHEVRNHLVQVVARRGEQADWLGTLQYPARRLSITAP